MLDGSEERDLEVFLINPQDILKVRSRLFSGEADLEEVDGFLLESANAAMISGPFSVRDKDALSPSSDKNDYVSLDPFWWPDPERGDGRPYFYNGEKQNPECEQYDRPQLAAFSSAIDALCMGYFFTDYEDFAARAALLLRVWFFDSETRMKPNMTYAGFIPGRNQGDPAGIMESRVLSWIPDNVGLLANSKHWTSEDGEILRKWFKSFIEWLSKSPNGLNQRLEKNQNGTWYDVQLATMSLFVGDLGLARDAINRCFERAKDQIDTSGSHHIELKHCDGIYAASNNLLGLFDMADLGRNLNMDLWSGESGRLLRSALDWLISNDAHNLVGRKNFQNVFDRNEWVSILRRAALRWSESSFEAVLTEIKGINVRAHRSQLLFPSFR